MEGITVLEFKWPCSKEYKIKLKGAKFAADRHYGKHKGVDFPVHWGHKVFASERGRVVFSGMVDGSKTKTNYGNVVVIDHTFEARCKGRYLYTLYAHMHTRKARKGREVKKGEVIGKAGNSGTKEFYIAKEKKGIDKIDGTEKGYHLHFEMIDSPRPLVWSKGSWNSILLRKDPFNGYIGSTITLDCEEVVPNNMTRFGDSLKSTPFGRRFLM
jgi:murein DD-endopeptidase MepM/ murein hydrolase activator NlpD